MGVEFGTGIDLEIRVDLRKLGLRESGIAEFGILMDFLFFAVISLFYIRASLYRFKVRNKRWKKNRKENPIAFSIVFNLPTN